MNYTKLKDIATLNDKDIVEAIAATIAFVGDPETKPSSNSGKPVTKQSLKLTASDGTEIWADNYAESCFMDRSKKGSKVIIASTVKDGKMQGINVNKWNDKVGLRLFGGTNFTFPDAQPAQQSSTPQAAKPQQQPQQAQPQQQYAKSAPVNGLEHIAALWVECYERVKPVCGEAHAVQAAATLFIEANKRNIGPTLTSPKAALASFESSARKIADVIIDKGGYDADKLPDGAELDEIVDILIDKAAESISLEKIGVAFDAFVAGHPKGREAAVKTMLSSWDVFLGGVK